MRLRHEEVQIAKKKYIQTWFVNSFAWNDVKCWMEGVAVEDAVFNGIVKGIFIFVVGFVSFKET